VNVYEEYSCGGDVVSVVGNPTQVCLPIYANNKDTDVSGSFMYMCNNGTLCVCIFLFYFNKA
jgi:hypothetical protein